MSDKRQRRSFNYEFKHQIVQLYNAGKPKSEICREYDLVPTVVDRWIKRINAHKYSISAMCKFFALFAAPTIMNQQGLPMKPSQKMQWKPFSTKTAKSTGAEKIKIAINKGIPALGGINFVRARHVETVVLLSHKKPDNYIEVKMEF